MSRLISVIIVSWNRCEDILGAIESVKEQSYRDKEIIVVDNGSTDDTTTVIKKLYPDVRLYELGINTGCPEGRNYGAKRAKGELLFFLDDDGRYKDANLIEGVVEIFERKNKLGALYIKVVAPNGIVDSPIDAYQHMHDDLILASSFRGGASIIRTELYRKLGGFPGDFFRQAEEAYLSLKIYAEGYYVAYYPRFTMVHKGSEYIGKNKIVATKSMENRVKTIARLYPLKYIVPFSVWQFLIQFRPMMENNAMKEYIANIAVFFKELLIPNYREDRIPANAVLLVENIKAGNIKNINDVSGKRMESLIHLLFTKNKFTR